MLKLDKNDPLDRMILQELHDDPVTFDVFLDAMDELDEEPDQKEYVLHSLDVLKDAEECRADFWTRLSKYGMSTDNRFQLCADLYTKAQKNPSSELRRIYCEILCDPGFLLDQSAVPTDEEDRLAYQEQIVLQYLGFCQERDRLLKLLARREELAGKFSRATKKSRNSKTVNCEKDYSYEIAAYFTAIFDIPEKESGDILIENLSNYIQLAEESPELKSIEPLFLFRLLTKHRSRICKVPDLDVNLSALWKRDKQQIDRNNGRNFKQYGKNLSLFKGLCKIYQDDKDVDFPLCWYGLDQVTVLGDFYREHISTGWEYMDQESDCPFIPTVEEIVEDACFSCFQDCYGENVILASSDVTHKELERFQSNEKSPAFIELGRISNFMNDHGVDLAVQMAQSTPDQVRTLCRDILEQSKIKYRPKSPHEAELFLAAINSGLMDLQDWLASYLLIQTGHALLGEPAENVEWLA